MQIYLYLRDFPAFDAPPNSGFEKAVSGLAWGFNQCGIKVTILCEGQHDSIYKSRNGYVVRCFAKASNFVASHSLENFIRNHIVREDVVILNGMFNPRVYFISQTLRNYGIPYIFAPHGQYNSTLFAKNPHLKLTYWYLFERPMLQAASIIQTLNPEQVVWLKGAGIQTRIIETTNGFLPKEVMELADLRWTITGTPKLFYYGRLETYIKGLDILMDAFSDLIKTFDAQLVFQGPDQGGKEKLERQAAKLGISKSIKILPPEYGKIGTEVISKYDVFCLTSRVEAFSMAALEAMLAGRPLLMTRNSAVAAYVEAAKCGVVADPTPSAMASALRQILSSRSTWQQMGMNGRDYILENMRWDKLAASLLVTYKEPVPVSKRLAYGEKNVGDKLAEAYRQF